MQIQELGGAAPQRGNNITRWVGRGLLALFGWKIVGQIPDLPKFVIIGAPHTSNWDFPLAMLLFMALGLRVSWMGKHTFVNGPFKRLWRWLGGVAIDRRSPHGVVQQMVSAFDKRESFVLGITPEGTRQKVAQWKTGFYHIAHGANVPILPVAIDYGRRAIRLHPAFVPSGEAAADIIQIQALFTGTRGKRVQ